MKLDDLPVRRSGQLWAFDFAGLIHECWVLLDVRESSTNAHQELWHAYGSRNVMRDSKHGSVWFVNENSRYWKLLEDA